MATQGCDQSAQANERRRLVHSGQKAINPGARGQRPRGKQSRFPLCRRGGLSTPAPWAALEDVAVMQQPVKHRTHGGDIAEQFAPILDRAV